MKRIVGVLILTAVALLPVFAPDRFPLGPQSGPRPLLGLYASLLLPLGVVFICWRMTDGDDRRRKAGFLALLCLLAGLLTYVHHTVIDRGAYFPHQTNLEWQIEINEAAVSRDTDFVPHSYRFLPDSLVRLTAWLCGSFVVARTLYRFSFGLLLLFLIHRFARKFLPRARAALVVLFYCAVYPVTILAYAGQLADPMSHVSFVAAFLALHAGAFPAFLLAISIGALAKESVVAMIGYYVLFGRREDPMFWRNLILACAICAGTLIMARLPALRDGFSYGQVSGVGLSHISDNLGAWRVWLPQVLFTGGLFLPFVYLGWSRAASMPKRLTLFLLPVLGLSNLVFSWIHEVRNFVPLLIPMAVITVGYLWPESGEGNP